MKCRIPSACLRGPKGCSTMLPRATIASGCSSSRCALRSRAASWPCRSIVRHRAFLPGRHYARSGHTERQCDRCTGSGASDSPHWDKHKHRPRPHNETDLCPDDERTSGKVFWACVLSPSLPGPAGHTPPAAWHGSSHCRPVLLSTASLAASIIGAN